MELNGRSYRVGSVAQVLSWFSVEGGFREGRSSRERVTELYGQDSGFFLLNSAKVRPDDIPFK